MAVLDNDLEMACRAALTLSRDEARAFAVQRNWRTCTKQFLSNLAIEVDP